MQVSAPGSPSSNRQRAEGAFFTLSLRLPCKSHPRFYAPPSRLHPSFFYVEVGDGHRVSGGHRTAVGPDGVAGRESAQAGAPARRPAMMLYGFGGLVAVLLLAYLVYALICAEEF